ncbi:MAG: hypothetical protein KDA87_22550 [Planctomycetales bacterium]|nr:hypothetical protein [Planctomycetales bacterium]
MKKPPRPIIRPYDVNRNPARRGVEHESPFRWRSELLSRAERRREVRVVVLHLILFSFALQLGAGTVPGFEDNRGIMLIVALIIVRFVSFHHPMFFLSAAALSPFCLLAPWYTEFIILRFVISIVATLLAAYQFRQHLIGLVTAGPLHTSAAERYRKSGQIPRDAKMVSLATGLTSGFTMALSSWFTYLGNEQRLATIYRSPAGFCYSRTFLTILGVFGMVFLLPHDFIFLVLAKYLTLIHRNLVLLALFLTLLGPVVAMTMLAFVFTADRLRSAVSLNRYGTLEHTFPDLMKELAPKESQQ